MGTGDRLLHILLVWLIVYPAVTALSYVLTWLGLDEPRWLQIGISTLFTVPFISLVAVPLIERLLAHRHGQSRSDLKREEADASDD